MRYWQSKSIVVWHNRQSISNILRKNINDSPSTLNCICNIQSILYILRYISILDIQNESTNHFTQLDRQTCKAGFCRSKQWYYEYVFDCELIEDIFISFYSCWINRIYKRRIWIILHCPILKWCINMCLISVS